VSQPELENGFDMRRYVEAQSRIDPADQSEPPTAYEGEGAVIFGDNCQQTFSVLSPLAGKARKESRA